MDWGHRLHGEAPEPTRGWRPPGWGTDYGAARYFAASTDRGYVGHLEVGASVSEQDIREFLVGWIERRGSTPRMNSGARSGCAFLSITVATQGLQVASFSYGPSPAPEEWPRVPLADLMMFAALDLRGE
jgi:hypothetical protein